MTSLLVLAVLLGMGYGCAPRDAREAEPSVVREVGPEPAIRWRERGLRGSGGRLRAEDRARALRQRERSVARWVESAAPLEGPSWTPQGPTTRGGRARALVIHPENPSILWAAAGSGGVWKSENAGRSWRPLTDHLGLPSGSLVLDPRDPDRLYWGTGERFHAGGLGGGVYLSRNGGESWKLLRRTRRWTGVPSIAISPDSSEVLLAAVADLESRARSGVYRSLDAGDTWSRVLAGDPDEPFTPSEVAFQPGNGARALASSREGFLGSLEAVVRYSDDGGVTWQRSTGLVNAIPSFDRYVLAFAPSAPDTVFAASRQGVFRSSDGGASFVQVSSQPLGRASWTSMIWVSPADPQLLYSGGIAIWRSFDGGESWEPIEARNTGRDIGHLDHHAVVADPGYDGTTNRRVYLLNDGGIDRLEDARVVPLDFRELESLDRGMQTTEYYAVAGRARDGLLLGGTQDRGVLNGKVNRRRSRVEVGGDGACSLIDPAQGRYLYGCGQYLFIVRIRPRFSNLADDLPDAHSLEGARANFIAPVLLDPNAPFRMLAGGASLWRSEDARRATTAAGERAVWTEIKAALPSLGPGDDRGFISAIDVVSGDSEEIWVAHNNGHLYRTSDGLSQTPTWQAIDDNATRDPLPDRWIARVKVDIADTRRVFVALGGFRRANVWRTEDGGESWQAAGGRGRFALPRAPVWSLAQHPERPDTWVAGTEVGVYRTEDGGERWAAVPSPIVAAAQDLTFLQGSTTLLVGTFGRGLWTVELE